MTSFLCEKELSDLGLGACGIDVKISRHATIYSPEKIFIGNHVRIDDFCILSGGEEICIGNYVHIAAYCALYGAGRIVFEDFTTTSSRVSVYSITDDYSGRSLTNPTVPDAYKHHLVRKPVKIAKHVIVGANSTILPGVTISEGCAVGAHSLITKTCESWSVYFGVPAKRIKARSKELLQWEKEFLAGEGGQ